MESVINIHYIYINKYDKFDTTIPDFLLELKDKYVKQPCTKISFHTYTDLYNDINLYNTEYGFLFSKINPLFPAALSDIGRIFLLWKYGGIYHDLDEYIDDSDVLQNIVEKLNKLEFLFMNKPSSVHKCANSNMASIKYNLLFERILATQFKNIYRVKKELLDDSEKKHNLWRETGMVFLYELIKSSGAPVDQLPPPTLYRDSAIGFHDHFIHWEMIKRKLNYQTDGEHWSELRKTEPLVLI